MLDYARRFHGLNSLTYVYRHGQTVRGPLLALKYSLNKRRDSVRVAVVVSKKVDKSAVVRNRIRRRIYEVVRPLIAGVDQPYDLVFTAFSVQLVELETAKLQQLVAEQLTKAGITPPTKPKSRAIVNP